MYCYRIYILLFVVYIEVCEVKFFYIVFEGGNLCLIVCFINESVDVFEIFMRNGIV